MDETTRAVDTDPEEPDLPREPAPPIQSRFLFVDVAALRAKQLRRGARVRLGDDSLPAHKAERLAMEEVRRGLVYYDVPQSKSEAAGGNGDAAGGSGSSSAWSRGA